jgi:hypothetical protein
MTSRPTVYAVNMLTIVIILIQLQLATQFLSCAGIPVPRGIFIGFGLRLAQEIRAHRKGSTSTTTVDDELGKRALWQVQIHPFLSVVLIHHSRTPNSAPRLGVLRLWTRSSWTSACPLRSLTSRSISNPPWHFSTASLTCIVSYISHYGASYVYLSYVPDLWR